MADMRPIHTKWLNNLHKALSKFEGREFEIQGKVCVTKSDDGVTLKIDPLEKISIRKLSSAWEVDFTINDADGHGLPWTHTGAWGHVIHGFRGYVVHQLAPLLSDQELRDLVRLIS
jgi:hypothetical protein